MVKEKKFRRDLYFKINILNLKLSNLNEKRDDVP